MCAKLRPFVVGTTLIFASFSLYLGIMVYLMATDPKFASEDSHRDVVIAQSLILAAVALDMVTAWMIPRRYGIFLVRLIFAILLNIIGAIWAFGLIFARTQLFKST